MTSAAIVAIALSQYVESEIAIRFDFAKPKVSISASPLVEGALEKLSACVEPSTVVGQRNYFISNGTVTSETSVGVELACIRKLITPDTHGVISVKLTDNSVNVEAIEDVALPKKSKLRECLSSNSLSRIHYQIQTSGRAKFLSVEPRPSGGEVESV